MDIDVNLILINVPESVFKAKIAGMLLKLNKSMGNSHTADEIAFVSQEIWRPLYFRNSTVPIGTIYSYYDDTLLGKTNVKKITVQVMLSSIQAYMDKFKESDRVNKEKLINIKEQKQSNDGLLNATAPIAMAACWMISKRCDGYDMDKLSTRQVCEWIEQGKDPELLLKEICQQN